MISPFAWILSVSDCPFRFINKLKFELRGKPEIEADRPTSAGPPGLAGCNRRRNVMIVVS